jgi:hypothetical protein
MSLLYIVSFKFMNSANNGVREVDRGNEITKLWLNSGNNIYIPYNNFILDYICDFIHINLYINMSIYLYTYMHICR